MAAMIADSGIFYDNAIFSACFALETPFSETKWDG
jgi:hypothetical protein